LKKLLLNIYFWSAFLVVTLLGLGILPFFLFVDVALNSRRIDSTLRRAIRIYGWLLVCVVPFFRPVKVIGVGRIPDGPLIFTANHNSAVDPYLFGAVPVENGFVTSWPFKIPVYGFFMRLAGYANTDEGWEEVSIKCRRLFAAGSSVIIWPEGHRSRDGSLGRFKKGAFKLAVQTGLPVVPVCIAGSGKVLPPGHRLLRPGRIVLYLLDPVYPQAGADPYRESVRMKKEVRSAIEKQLRAVGQLE
jgi:1-acyl-sn-glycerol-3-phosphate acyltransferase